MPFAAQSELARELTGLLGADCVRHHEQDLLLFSYDASADTSTPRCVVLPRTTEQVASVVSFAHANAVPITPRGGGTSLSGGPVPVDGGIVVSLTRMNQILELDAPSQRAVVQPGCICLDLQSAVDPLGFFYAPDPASQVACTLGGNVGENAGGPHCLKYGVTANHVTGLQIVLPDGEVLRTGGKALDSPGLDLTGVIVGSEGTFGIVTEITCRLLPQPQTVTTMLAVFDSLDDASATVSGIIGAGLLPATLEMMDKHLIYAVQQSFDAGYPPDAEVVLIIEVDGLEVAMEPQLERIRQLCEQHGVRQFKWARDEAERALLWRGRKGAFSSLANLSPNQLVSDVAVPRTELPYVLHQVMEIAAKHDVEIGNVFHAGDGNLHPHILYDARDPDLTRRAREADEEITRLAVSRGGVLTGEHGVGACKRKSMPLLFSPASLRALWALKDAFDPQGLMNPKKVLPARGSIDPAAPPALPHGSFEDAASRLVIRDDEGFLCPYDAEALGKLLCLAHREHLMVRIRGAGSKQPEGHDGRVIIGTAGLKKVLSLDPENLTVRVEAGVRWRQLEQALAQVGQRVPLRPRLAEQATVGGVIATDSSGPHRHRHGTCRDLITGLRFVLPSGDVVMMGGGCVKNVSGYALEKLLIGSMGTIGVIVDATFRTVPLPEVTRALCFSSAGCDDGPGEPIARLGRELTGAHLQLAAVEALSPALASRALGDAGGQQEGGWTLALSLEGLAEEVDYLSRNATDLALGLGLTLAATLEGDACDAFWSTVTDVGTPCMQLSAPLSAASELAAGVVQAVRADSPMRLGLGTGILCVAAEDLDLASLHALASELGGNARWLAPAPSGQTTAYLHGPVVEYHRRLKTAYDPQGILPDVGFGLVGGDTQ